MLYTKCSEILDKACFFESTGKHPEMVVRTMLAHWEEQHTERFEAMSAQEREEYSERILKSVKQ